MSVLDYPGDPRVRVSKLAGVAELAEMLHVGRSAIGEWRRRAPGFPEPLFELAMGPVWDREEVKVWFRTYVPGHGQPKKGWIDE